MPGCAPVVSTCSRSSPPALARWPSLAAILAVTSVVFHPLAPGAGVAASAVEGAMVSAPVRGRSDAARLRIFSQ